MLIVWVLAYTSANLCQDALNQEARSVLQVVFQDHSDPKAQSIALKQFLYSGKDINDLGHYSSCMDLPDSNYLLLDFKLSPMSTYIGVCVPSECTAETLSELLSGHQPTSIAIDLYIPQPLSAAIPFEIRVFSPYKASLGLYGVITIFCISILLSAIALGTYLDLFQKSSQNPSETEPKPTKSSLILTCFSFKKNWNSLFFSTAKDTTQIFDGVRTLSVGWVVLAHVYVTRLYHVTYNIEEIFYVFESPLAAFGYSAPICLDAFFWIGGFLVGFLALDEIMQKKKMVSWKFKTFARVLRLLPVYIFVMAFVNFVEPSTGSGPQWHKIEEILTLDCSSYWWTNFLFINNFVPLWVGNNCIGQSWYLAVDM